MKTKIIALVIVAVFLGSLFAGSAWAEESSKIENKKSYKGRFIFKWLKLFFRVLKLEWAVSQLKQAVRKLNSDLDRETFERQSGDRRLKLIIDDEAETREKDDIALGEEIDREAAAREQGDERLANALADEKSEREEADENLQEQIDSIEAGTAKHPIFFSSGADQTVPTRPQFMGLGHLGLSAAFGIITPMSGEIKDLYGFSILKLEPNTGESIFFQLYRNDKETELKCEIDGSDRCINNTTSVPVEAGDKLSVFVVASSTTAATEVKASMVLESTGSMDLNKFVLNE